MTVDELVALVDALIGDTTVSDIRHGDTSLTDTLDDVQFILLMRFMAGERPTPAPSSGLTMGEWAAGVARANAIMYPDPSDPNYDPNIPDEDEDSYWVTTRDPDGYPIDEPRPVQPNEFSGITLP